MVRWIFLLAAMTALGRSQNVFDPDARVPLESRRWPASAVGQVVGGPRCTGTLVGERLVLTAAHCLGLVGGLLDPKRPIHFLPQVVNGISQALNRPRAVAAWSGGWQKDADSRSGDWAIVLLDEAPERRNGKPFGWVGVRAENLKEGTLISTAGYSEDFHGGLVPSIHESCRVRETFSDGHFHHDCSGYAGVSGGPVMEEITEGGTKVPYVVGITNSHFSDGGPGLHLPEFTPERANVGAAASVFLPKLTELKQFYR